MPADPPAATTRPAPPDPGQADSGPAARPGPADLIAAALAALEPLAARLRAEGWRTGLQAPPGHLPVLEVANPGMPMLADTITARPDGDGQWWLWWSWAQRIAPAADLDLATAVATKVLGGP